jgi:hypothetical protein
MLAAKLIDEQQLRAGLRDSSMNRQPLSISLSRLFGMNTAELFDALAVATGVPRHHPLNHRPSAEAKDLVDQYWVKSHRVIPVCHSSSSGDLIVATCDPTETGPIEYLRKRSPVAICAELASDDEFNLLCETIYGPVQNQKASHIERLPSTALIPNDPIQAQGIEIQDMDSMRNQIHQADTSADEGHRAHARGLSIRRGSSPIPLPTDALTMMPSQSQWLQELEITEQTGKALETVFALCLKKGLFTREEYLHRLNTDIDPG